MDHAESVPPRGSARHVQGVARGPAADLLPAGITPQRSHDTHECVIFCGHANINQANRLFPASAARARNAGDADAKIACRQLADVFGPLQSSPLKALCGVTHSYPLRILPPFIKSQTNIPVSNGNLHFPL